MKELIINVVDWAAKNNVLDKKYSEKQFLKIIEEVGELCQAILKDNEPDKVDAIGDIMVTLIIYQHQVDGLIDLDTIIAACQLPSDFEPRFNDIPDLLRIVALSELNNSSGLEYAAYRSLAKIAKFNCYSLEECLDAAYNVIKDRNVKLVNGTLVK